MSGARPALRSVLRAGTGLALLLDFALLTRSMACAPDVPFLVGGPGPWMGAPRPVDTQLVAVPARGDPGHSFVRRFEATTGDAGFVELRALKRFEAELNGHVLTDPADGQPWRSVRRIDLAPLLRDGRNELRVRVHNSKGPQLLQATLQIGDRTIPGNGDWQVIRPGANPVQATRADDTRPHPDAYLLPEPGQVMYRHALPLGLGLLVCLALAGSIEILRPAWFTRQRLAAAAGFALAFWLAVFVAKSSQLPAVMGFDAPAHLQYIELIRSQARLPLAHEGFQTYHPPLYHALTAAVVALFGSGPESPSASMVYRLISTLSGFACVLFAGLTARRLWPRDDTRVAVTTLFACVLPVGVYTAAHLGNESFHAACVSGALYVATRILTQASTHTRDLVWLGLCLSMALLTKFTSLALTPIILAFVVAKLFWLEGSTARRAIGTGVALGAGIAVASGWFYLRNFLEYGDPVVWNLDIPGAPTWWLQPGFHTPAWLLSFGEGVRHPIFAGFTSLWDGLYSTFWGDGLVAGMASAHTRHGAWNEPLMLVGYWLAIPTALPLAYGGLRAAHASLVGNSDSDSDSEDSNESEPEGRNLARALLLSISFALGLSMVLISLRLPFYAQPKASYILATLVPITIFGADGLVALTEGLPPALSRAGRIVIWGWALCLFMVLAGSFLA